VLFHMIVLRENKMGEKENLYVDILEEIEEGYIYLYFDFKVLS